LPRINATLRDADGIVIDSYMTRPSLSRVITIQIPPSVAAPFDLRVGKEAAARTHNYSLVADCPWAYNALSGGSRFADTPAKKLEILNITDSKNALGWLEIAGEIENRGYEPITGLMTILGTFYDANGRVVYVAEAEYWLGEKAPISPGATLDFTLTVESAERTNRIARYKIMAESWTSRYELYSTVPELSWPTVSLCLVFATAVLALGRKRRYEKHKKGAPHRKSLED